MTEIHIEHDGTLDIAIGRNRKETSWKNKEWEWSDLVKKVSTTHRTAETHAEYLGAKKPRQDEIKDIGGFVGGYLSSGRRKSGNVVHRQLLTLDVDFANTSFWDDFTMMYGNAAVLYSTHKHSGEHPRLRLIIPLDRAVMPDEYEAIARRIAGVLDIELFDPTTFQPARLMYWPSTSKDADYVFEYQDGPWLCADTILATYHNWKDTSEWPVSTNVDKIIQRSINKQGDPLDPEIKKGVVGAFCRTYNIHEAIDKFLGDAYEYCDNDRYTYKHGSTAAGLVTYDDVFAYSHHGTDPVSGKLCNAFDLVRLHKYGLKDEDAREGTPGNKLPSYTAMVEFASKDGSVRKTLGAERMSEATADFGEVETVEVEVIDDTWLEKMDVDRKGNYHSTINNIILILNNDPRLKGCFALNKFEQREVALKNLPWRKITGARYLIDTDDDGVCHYLENTYGISNVSKTKAAMNLVTLQNAFHPVRDFLDAVEWDKEERLDTLLIDYLGATDSDYVRAVTRKTFVAAVARIYRPGVKFDYVLTLVGKQGIGKSSIIKKLGGDWYSDSFGTVQGKEAFEQIQGVWLVEMGELAGMKKADMETVKHFISKQEDRYRVAYGRRTENFPRQCVFFGTTNNRDFLRDPTGNRRFWPVDTMEQEPAKDLFTDLTPEEISQVWAEAVSLFKAGETLYLNKQLEEVACKVQTEHVEQDERTGFIQKYLDILLPEKWPEMGLSDRRDYIHGTGFATEETSGEYIRDYVCIAEIWCELLNGQQKEMNRFNTKDLHEIMKKVEGWEVLNYPKNIHPYGRQRTYKRVLQDENSSNTNNNVRFNNNNTSNTKKQHK